MKMEFEKETLVLPITDILSGLRRRVSLDKVSYSNDEELFAKLANGTVTVDPTTEGAEAKTYANVEVTWVR